MTPLKLFQNILCPVDFSRHSRRALHYAALLAVRNEARLTALFVEDPFLAATAMGANMLASTRADLRKLVEQSVRPYGVSPGSIDVRTAVGKPYSEIARTARRAGCDLIVMGAHGATGTSKMMMGSTTERVLRTAGVPVLAIPPFNVRASLSRKWPGKLVLVPVDIGPHLRHDTETGAEVTERLGALLALLHVVPTRHRTRLLKARTRLDTLVKNLRPGTVVMCRVLAGKPDEQIAAMAADADVDLVVLTRRRGKGLFGAQLGSISYRVLCEARVPVLALPASSKWLHRTDRASVNDIRRAS